MNVAAGIFLFLFGGLGAWLIFARAPRAHFTRAAYVFMSAGGIVFVVWSFTRLLGVGLAGVALLLLAGICGAVGAFRKEMRCLPPV